MKKTLLFILLVIAVSLRAPELLIPSELMNQNPRLRYSFTVYSATDKTVATEIANEMRRLFTDKKLDFEYAPALDTVLVDIVFHFDGKALSYHNTQIPFNTVANVARQGVEILGKEFYSGMRPTYSTVFKGDDGKYAEYRIPSVVALPNGRIVAFIEARAWHKDQAENDIIARYSDDMGQTWSPQIVVDEQGQSSLNNACAVYIAERNEIMVMYQSFPPKVTEGSISSDGAKLRAFTVTSKDGGETWSQPKDITQQVVYPGMKTVCSGPGIAIRSTAGLDKGRILVPFNANGGGRWFNSVVYSDDLGNSWKMTKGYSGYGANESQMVQTGPDTYLINARSHRYPNVNTLDAPAGWNPWNFSRVTRNRVNTPLILTGNKEEWWPTEVQVNQPDPTCQGSILRQSGWGVGDEAAKSRILLSNPASQHTVLTGRPYANTPPQRINGTVKLSYDEGKTWTYGKRIYGNRFTEYQYSVLVNMGNGKIGCLFEAFPEVKFAVFDMEWLTGGEDTSL